MKNLHTSKSFKNDHKGTNRPYYFIVTSLAQVGLVTSQFFLNNDTSITPKTKTNRSFIKVCQPISPTGCAKRTVAPSAYREHQLYLLYDCL